MRELEFLPTWYPQIRRRRRLAVLQAYMVLVTVAALGGWLWLSQRNLGAARASVQSMDMQLGQAQLQLQKLDQAIAKQGQLRQASVVMQKLGGYVEATRIISGALGDAMPPDMGLLDLSMQTEEMMAANLGGLAASRLAQEGLERHLRVRLTGVVPNDVDLANFLAKLGNNRFVDQVAMTYSRDKQDGGHLMREFEVTFCVSLGGAAN